VSNSGETERIGATLKLVTRSFARSPLQNSCCPNEWRVEDCWNYKKDQGTCCKTWV